MRKTLDMMKVTSTYGHTLILFMFISPGSLCMSHI